MSTPNPWLKIPAKEYELHMADQKVLQLQTLNRIMKSQIEDYSPKHMAVFGVTTGNGLEHAENIENVYAIDINDEYLNICRARFNQSKNMNFLKLDIEKDDYHFGKIDLAICNLIFEYVDESNLAKKIFKILLENSVLSLIFQANQNGAFISQSKYSGAFSILDKIHHDVEEIHVSKTIESSGYIKIKREEYALPNNKKLIRIDFKKRAS